MQLTEIRWEEALNVANAATNELEGARKVQIKTQLKKLNYRYYKNKLCPPRPAFNQFKNR